MAAKQSAAAGRVQSLVDKSHEILTLLVGRERKAGSHFPSRHLGAIYLVGKDVQGKTGEE
jgi:hypothetical protein